MYNYLKAFIIGSSIVILFPFFYIVSNISSKVRNYSYVDYTLFAPFFLGIVNVFLVFLNRKTLFYKRTLYLLVSILVPTIVASYAKLYHMYNLTNSQWLSYVVSLYLLYFFIINIGLYHLNSLLIK